MYRPFRLSVSLVVKWLGFGALTAAARVRFPVRELTLLIPVNLIAQYRLSSENNDCVIIPCYRLCLNLAPKFLLYSAVSSPLFKVTK